MTKKKAAKAAAPRHFTKISADGKDLPFSAKDWVAVRDERTGLIWSRGNVSAERLKQKDAVAACKKLKLAGMKGWRAPTIQELLTLVDYERHSPAIDTDFFQCESAWYWTSTAWAPSPGGSAWGVGFDGGDAYYGGRDGGGFVRAVRASQ